MEQSPIASKESGLDENFRFWGQLVLLSVYITQPFGKLGSIDLPFIEAFMTLDNSVPFQVIWQTSFVICSIGVLSKKCSKAFMFLAGFLILSAVLANGFRYSNNLFFGSCLLIAMSMSSFKQNFVRYQLFVVYLGAFLDKLFFDHWRNGYFMESFFENTQYVSIAEAIIGNGSIPILMATGTIVVEAILALLVLIPRATKQFIVLGVSFHLSTAIMMHSFFGLFIPCILMSYASLVPSKQILSKRLPRLEEITRFPKFHLAELKNTMERTIFAISRSVYVWIVLTLILSGGPFPLQILSAIVWFGLTIIAVNATIKNQNAPT